MITDATLVDMSFGTGAVKVTPAHDPNDFLCGRRHGMEEITIFTEEGQMNDECGPFKGMMRFDARVELLKALKEKGLFRGECDNKMRVPKCSRTVRQPPRLAPLTRPLTHRAPRVAPPRPARHRAAAAADARTRRTCTCTCT